MKQTDDYSAKIAFWLNSKVRPRIPRADGLPAFSAKKFSSYAEMNAWKKDYLREIARQGGVQWKN